MTTSNQLLQDGWVKFYELVASWLRADIPWFHGGERNVHKLHTLFPLAAMTRKYMVLIVQHNTPPDILAKVAEVENWFIHNVCDTMFRRMSPIMFVARFPVRCAFIVKTFAGYFARRSNRGHTVQSNYDFATLENKERVHWYRQMRNPNWEKLMRALTPVRLKPAVEHRTIGEYERAIKAERKGADVKAGPDGADSKAEPIGRGGGGLGPAMGGIKTDPTVSVSSAAPTPMPTVKPEPESDDDDSDDYIHDPV